MNFPSLMSDKDYVKFWQSLALVLELAGDSTAYYDLELIQGRLSKEKKQ